MKNAIRRSLRAALLVLLSGVSARAIELDLTRPPPTLHGASTAFEASVSGAVGSAELRWDFGDGNGSDFSASSGPIEHTYAAPGHYTVIVVARDDDGFTSRSFLHTVHTSPTLAPARSSSSLLFDEARGLVIAANSDNGTVTLVDATTLAKVDEIPVFSHPVAIELAADGRLWVVHQDDHAVAIVDLDARKAVDFFRLPYASLPAGIVFSPQGDASVPLLGLGEVIRIDGSSHEITARRPVAPFLRGITISGDGGALWVTRFISQGRRGEIYRLDAETLETLARYDLAEDTTTEDSDAGGRGLPNYLFSVAVTPDGTRAWCPPRRTTWRAASSATGSPSRKTTRFDRSSRSSI